MYRMRSPDSSISKDIDINTVASGVNNQSYGEKSLDSIMDSDDEAKEFDDEDEDEVNGLLL